MNESRLLKSDMNDSDVVLVSMILLFMISFKIRLGYLTGVPTEIEPS